jgi:hypothetical protein
MARFSIFTFTLILAAAILALGAAADVSFSVGQIGQHLLSVPLVLATFTPWVAIFVFIAGMWAAAIDSFFKRKNQDATKGLAHEIAVDNNAAAAIIVTVPVVVLAVLLLAISILTR